ncbi:MAG: hypothetical protein ACJ76N_11235 [Thermoanaerobaculia bacterium]
MTDLTETERHKLVRRLNDVSPCPDHYLVVFKRDGGGKKLRACVAPGEPFKKPFFESPESFIAFAVISDQNLRHSFRRPYRTHDLLHSFWLDFVLDYRIANPSTLVEKLDQDPLKRLENEVHLLLVQKNKALDWSMIEREQIDLEDVLFNTPDTRRHVENESNLEKLSQFSGALGFEVKRVVVTRDLPAKEIQVSNRHLEASREQAILAINHGTNELKQNLDHRLEDNQKSFDRRNFVADGIANNVKTALDQATEPIRSFDDIQRAMGKVAQIQGTILGLAAGGAAPPMASPSTPTLLGGGVAGLLPQATPASPLTALLESFSTTLGTVDCSPMDRRQLLAACLHVIAESLKGEEGNTELLAQYAGALSATFERLLPVLNPGQIKFLRSLQNSSSLKRELS